MAHPIPEVLHAFANGEIVVVTDDDDREGEGDLIVAASLCSAEKMAFIIRHTSGIVCAPVTTEDARRLRLDPMVANNEKLVRHVRSLNTAAKIISTADVLSDVADQYAAGADYVVVTRLSDAHELFNVIEAADQGLLDDKRAEIDTRLSERREVLP